jgi:hypothetical protein
MWGISFFGGGFRVSFRLKEVALNAALQAQGLQPSAFHSNGLIIALLLIRADEFRSSQFSKHQYKNSGYGRCVMWSHPLMLTVVYLTITLSIGWLFSNAILYWL